MHDREAAVGALAVYLATCFFEGNECRNEGIICFHISCGRVLADLSAGGSSARPPLTTNLPSSRIQILFERQVIGLSFGVVTLLDLTYFYAISYQFLCNYFFDLVIFCGFAHLPSLPRVRKRMINSNNSQIIRNTGN